jgi:hypothetical protein
MDMQHLIPPGILKKVRGEPADITEMARLAFQPSDLYWTYQMYKIECRNGNRISADEFYGREERLDHVLRARRIMATCVLIALLFPNASWIEPSKDN